MTEIPKDGKTYLAWHKSCGMVLVFWVDSFSIFAPLLSEGDVYRYANEIKKGICKPEQVTSKFDRWMDERGNWHEVKDE